MIVIDGSSLTCDQLAAASLRRLPVTLSEVGRARAVESNAFADRVALDRPIYGRSTGVGANRTLGLVDPDSQALDLVRSHATASGPLRSAERVRAMLVIRLNQLAAGGSGADPRILDALAAMITADALPDVRELGSIGTGDLPALAVTALALMGEAPTARPAPVTVRFASGDALPFLSSNAATLADAALALVELRSLAESALVLAALSLRAVDGNPEAFSAAVEQATPFEGARQVCATIRELVEDGWQPARIQDPFGLRTLPQVHGAFLDELRRLQDTIERLINAPSENPVMLADYGVAHHGGFHAAYLAQALDSAALGAAQSAQLSLARLTMLDEPALTGRHPFLADGTPGSSGLMIAEYVAASALASVRAAATPAGLQSVTLSRGVEEDASFASLAAHQAGVVASGYRTVLAAELLAAVRCLRQRGIEPGRLAPAVAAMATVGVDDRDRDLTGDLAAAEAVVGELAQIMSSSGRSSSA
ncbi:MAG: histidine ammonia-lyase [Pseudonocardiales bacterium]|nr:histidine ammonia-lyase [Pseudonocardiales bacterium]